MSRSLKSRLLWTAGLLVAVHQAALAADNSDRVKTLTLRQNHYILGENNVDITKDAFRVYNPQYDVTIMVSAPDYKVREFSTERKIVFERTLDDFCSHGSSANWDYDENVMRLPWFQASGKTFLGRSANCLISPINPGAVSQLLKKGKRVDLEKHELAHFWYMPSPAYMKEVPSILSVLYRFPFKPGIPVELKGKYIGSDKPFWQQDRTKGKAEAAWHGVRDFLITKSISEGLKDKKFFEYHNAHYKKAREESEVYLTKDTNAMLQNMFAPSDESLEKKSPGKKLK